MRAVEKIKNLHAEFDAKAFVRIKENFLKDGKVEVVHSVGAPPWIGSRFAAEGKVCRRGEENLCLKPQNVGVFSQGGYATHMLVPSHRHLFDIGKLARELGVRYVLEGSVRRAGNRVRITAQLIDAASGHHLWADRYDRELADVFAVQDQIARQITGAIAPGILSAEVQHAHHADHQEGHHDGHLGQCLSPPFA